MEQKIKLYLSLEIFPLRKVISISSRQNCVTKIKKRRVNWLQFLGRNPAFKSSTVLHEKLAKNTVLNQLQISKKCLNAKGVARSAEDLKKKIASPVLSTKSARIFAPSDFS